MEEELQALRNIRVYLSKEIECRNILLEDSTKTCNELSTALKEANDEKSRLQQQINLKSQMLEEMDNRCTEISRVEHEKNELIQHYVQVMRKMESNAYDQSFGFYQENKKLKEHIECIRKEHEEQAKDMQRIKDQFCSLHQENQKLKNDIECLRKEHEQQAKEMERHKDQINLQQHFVTFAKRELKSELDTMEEKTKEVEDLKGEYQILMIMQRRSNDELQEARTTLLNGLHDLLNNYRGNRRTIGIKRMGELDRGPFRDACSQKVAKEELEVRSVELCSFWQEEIQKPVWHPFRVTSTDKSLPVPEIDESDEKLRNLKKEWGDKVYDVVTRALLEMNEYNGSGRYPVPEFWNFKEERRASLSETILYILNQLKSLKVYKRRRA